MLAKQKKANISSVSLSRSKLFRPNSLRIDSKQNNFQRASRSRSGRSAGKLFQVADFFMNEKEVPVCLMSLFKPEDPVVG